MVFTEIGKYGQKYFNLEEFFKNKSRVEITLTFQKIEEIISKGREHNKLPISAVNYRQWWANNLKHTQARSWMNSGWKVKTVDFRNRKVTFSLN